MGDADLSHSDTCLPVLEIQYPSGSKTIHYPLVYHGFPNEFKVRAMNELLETEEKKINGVQELRKFIKEQGMTRLDDDILTSILRNCKYDMKRSKSKLKKFETLRRTLVDELSNIPMGTIEQIYDDMGFGMLPYRGADGSVIIYTRAYGMNVEKYSLDEIGVCIGAGIAFLLSFQISTVAGITYFNDCKTPSIYLYFCIVNKFRNWMNRVLSIPVRISKVEMLNPNSMCRVAYATIRPILPNKIVNRVAFHDSKFEDLHKKYSPEILPDEFGGNMGPMSNKSYRQELLKFVKKLRMENV